MASLFGEVVTIVEREFYDDAFLRQRWQEIKATSAAEFAAASIPGGREAAIDGLLKALGVSHTMLVNPDLAATIAQQEDDNEGRRLRWHVSDATLFARVQSFNVRTTRVADIQRLAAALPGVQHLVLDLRFNEGGAGSVAVELASLFLPPETPILRFRDRIGRRLEAPFVVHAFPEDENLDHAREIDTIRQHHFVEYRTKADPGGRYGGTIVVLLDDKCYSCGEVFVQCMKEWSDATIVGKPSRGFVVAAQDYNLSDGYRLLLPFGEMWSGKDAKIEGVGVSPHVRLDLDGMDDGQVLSQLTNAGLIPARASDDARGGFRPIDRAVR